MFAVPGWALSPADLKRQTGEHVVAGQAHDKKLDEAEKSSKGSKKRKRREGPVQVNANNVAELWEKFIEGRGDPARPSSASTQQSLRARKKGKRDRQGTSPRQAEPVAIVGDSTNSDASHVQARPEKRRKGVGREEEEEKEKESKTRMMQRKERPAKQTNRKNRKNDQDSERASPSEERIVSPNIDPIKEPASTRPAVTSSEAQLTPLQRSMREKLISARFRHLNHNLYTTSSSDAFQHFQVHPDLFEEYHQGFRRQVATWPENPVDGFIRTIEQRGAWRPDRYSTKRVSTDHQDRNAAVQPLPRTNRISTIADLGCGEAKLAQALSVPASKKLKLQILSYDLQRSNEWVTVADTAHLPLRDESVDVAIFCLALMGTNWIEFIEEAYRVLRWKGELWIAEIKSRFVGTSAIRAARPATHHRGRGKQKRKQKGTKNPSPDRRNDEVDNIILAAVDNDDDDDDDYGAGSQMRDPTDVSAFVHVLRRRGFALSSPVDVTRNKMFVSMTFVKSLRPSIGNTTTTTMTDSGDVRARTRSTPKFLDDDNDDDDDNHANSPGMTMKMTLEEETKVLKPCVYKTR